MKIFKTILVIFFVPALLTIVLKLFVIQLYTVETDSMYKTIENNDKLLICKISELKANDIVLCKGPNENLLLSRVVALEGDSVMISGQNVFINGQKVKNKRQIMSYCLRFVNDIRADSLRFLYMTEERGNSGLYEIQLTDEEFKNIMNDSVSDLKLHLFAYEYLRSGPFSFKQEPMHFIIGNDSVFLINDNRANLNDSRSFGSVNKNKIIGKVLKSF